MDVEADWRTLRVKAGFRPETLQLRHTSAKKGHLLITDESVTSEHSAHTTESEYLLRAQINEYSSLTHLISHSDVN